jgi:hypothetical protein
MKGMKEMTDIRILTNQKRSLILLAILAAIVFALSSIPLAPLYFISFGLILFPLASMVFAAVGGWLPFAMANAVVALGACCLFGLQGLMVLVYAMPAGLALLIAIEQKLPFLKALALTLFSFIVGTLGFYLLTQGASGGDIFGFTSQVAVEALEQLDMRDLLLYNLWKGGLLSHGQPQGTQVFIENGRGWTFVPSVLEEFYKQISFRLKIMLQSVFQGLLTSFAIYMAGLGSYLALRLGSSVSLPDPCPTLDMLPFHQWHLPKEIGKQLWILGAGYLLMTFSASHVVQLMGSLMFNVFYAVYAMQGLSVFSFRLRLGGMRPWLRYLLLFLLFAILQPVLVFIGIIDQVRDSRGLRQNSRKTQE